MNRNAQPIGPRYTTRFRNGVHQVFDNVYYGVVGSGRNERTAQERADELNARPPKARKPQEGRK